MTFDNKKIHMIPPIIQQRAEALLSESNEYVMKENYALQLEQIILYCEEVLNKYEKKNKIRRKKV